jgi:serine/threonine protein kinase/beta-lactam-binding protein with PASTA domain
MPQISDSIGRVLGTRYRLLSALGTGASAHVFLAEDVSLQRHVAVKVLHPGLASDAAFLKRFGAEARSVASLNHPHILRVFDWGEDADGPYLVTEYLGGGSLRDILDHGVRLSHSQAAKLGAEVAQGLAYAHSRGLVHRDIKPANLLFDEEGRVRVADFGVARALAEAAWTEPEGAMVGTARYVSPESAEGKKVDGRADVYSLALVLYEAVSGTVPFVADTTLGTLTARMGAPLPPNPALGPLDDVLARAAAPEKEDRLDAAGFAARLGALASALPTPQPLPFRPPQTEEPVPISGFLPPDLSEQTQVRASMVPTAPVGTKAGPGELFDAEPLASTKLLSRSKSRSKSTSAAVGGAVAVVPRKSRKKLYWTLGAVVLVLALVAGGLVAAKEKVFTPSHPAPVLVGLTLAQAHAAATKDHFTLHLDHGIMSTTVPAGSVISQTPKVGTVLKQGSTLVVVPSIGPPPVTIPNLGGMTCAQAEGTLRALHLKPVCGAAQYSSTVASGILLEWAYRSTPNPTSAPYGSTITLVPSQGPAPVPVPALPAGYTYAQAQAAIQAVGLVAAEAPTTSTTVPAGQIIASDPASGASASFGSTVTVTVSTGPPTVAVPNVIGQTIAQASATLQAAGLVVSGVSGDPSKMAKGTDPATGAVVPTGSSVTILTH